MLRNCPGCGSERAALGSYERTDHEGNFDEEGDFFHLTIMCGECHTWRIVDAHEDECNDWEDDVLDPGTAAIARQAAALDRNRFLDWASVMAVAIREDLIGPEDFCRQSA